jgi:hypothetical protein
MSKACWFKGGFLISAMLIATSCVTLRDTDPERPPEITAEMSTEEAATAAVTYGEETFQAASRRFTERNEWPKVKEFAVSMLKSLPKDMTARQQVLLVQLYQSSVKQLDTEVFLYLVRNENSILRQAGWQLAAHFPRADLVPLIDAELSRIVAGSQEQNNLFPQLAKAVRANRVKAAYTFLRLGLMGNGDDEFARAMATLDPIRSTNDFMNYLTLANSEELRQITQKSVNVYSCIYIMKHFLAYPVNVSNPSFSQLFYYAISRNNALSDLGKEVLQFGVNGSPAAIALLLSREPAWVQIAFVESVRRTQQPKLKVLVSELLPLASDEGVAMEIREVLR